MTAQVKVKPLTADEFWALYGDKEEFVDGLRLHYELINGEAVDVLMPGFEHGAVQRRMAARLGDFVDLNRLGEVVTELHCDLSEDDVLVPDVSFIRTEQVQKINDRNKPLPFAPDLAIEIVSPGNSANEIATKVDLYLRHGSALVWVGYPVLRKFTVHKPDHTSYDVEIGGTLDGGNLLPGLAIPLADLFPPDEPKEAKDKTE